MCRVWKDIQVEEGRCDAPQSQSLEKAEQSAGCRRRLEEIRHLVFSF